VRAAGASGKSKGAGDLMRRVAMLRRELSGLDPAVLAMRSGAEYRASPSGPAEIRIPVWGRATSVGIPDFIARDPETGEERDPGTQALLAHHLRLTDGSPVEGRWVSFSELPDGAFYFRAFQGYTGDAITRVFGRDLPALGRAAEKLGGVREKEGDLSYAYRPLPRIPILLVCWRGDEEFPPSAKLLFDASARRHLPTDVCAILGGTLTRRLVRAGGDFDGTDGAR
jgi:hypothetical protein